MLRVTNTYHTTHNTQRGVRRGKGIRDLSFLIKFSLEWENQLVLCMGCVRV